MSDEDQRPGEVADSTGSADADSAGAGGGVVQPVRWRDLDAFGHVYHGEYLTLLDEARCAWLDRAGVRDPESFVVARLEIDYLRPVTRADGAVRVRVAVERLGRTSLTLRETMRAGGHEVARARTVVVLRDAESGASRPLDDDERARLEPFVAAGEWPARS